MLKKQINSERLRIELTECRDILPASDQAVLNLYYGLDGDEPKGLNDIAQSLEMRPEMAQQTHMRAIDYLTRMGHLPCLSE